MGGDPEPQYIRGFQPESVQFWTGSFEAAIRKYARELLALLMYDYFSVDYKMVAPETYCTFDFALRQNGELGKWRISSSSGDEYFDKQSQEAFLRASEQFPPLPTRAAAEMRFWASFNVCGPTCSSQLLQGNGSEEDFRFEISRVLDDIRRRRVFDTWKPKVLLYGLIMRRGSAEVLLLNQVVHRLEPRLREGMVEALSQMTLPESFPEEVRFVAECIKRSWTVFAYEYGPPWLANKDRLGERLHERRMAIRRARQADRLSEIEAMIRVRPGDLNLYAEAARCARGAGLIDRAIGLCKEAIAAKPKSYRGYDMHANYLRMKADTSSDPAEYSDEIIKYCELALAQRDIDVTTKRSNIIQIAKELARTGRYPEAVAAYSRTYECDELHGAIASVLEEIGDWENALREYRMADELRKEREDCLEWPHDAYANGIENCLKHLENG